MSLDELPPIYTAVPLTHDTNDDDNNDQPSSQKITVFHSLHFVTGCIVGNAHAILGFKRLYNYFHAMSTSNILMYSVIWSLITSLSGYLLYNLVWTILLYKAENCRKLKKFCKPHLLLQYEYATYLGIFLGFCLGCTAADVVYGMPWTCVAATVLMAMGWAFLMVWCGQRESALKEEQQQQEALSSPEEEVVRPLLIV